MDSLMSSVTQIGILKMSNCGDCTINLILGIRLFVLTHAINLIQAIP